MNTRRILAACITLALASPASSQAPAPKFTPLPPDTQLVADGPVVVSAADFEGNILRIPEDKRGGFRMSYDRVMAVVDNVFIARSVAQKARADGLDQDPAVQARLRQLQDAYLADLYMKKLEREVDKVDYEARARELYIADRDKYMTDEEVRMQQVLIGVKCRTKEAARDIAKRAHDEAVKPGVDFLALSTRYTDEGDKSDKGGDLGWSPVKAFVPQVREAVAKMKKGEISEPVESPFGFHVFKMLDRKPAQQKPFDAVKADIIAAEKAKAQKKRVEDAVAAIRSSNTVVTHADQIEKLVAPGIDMNELTRKAREAHARPATEEEKKSVLLPEKK
jgi:peptidyl-prolyl cis-trans isomerase C